MILISINQNWKDMEKCDMSYLERAAKIAGINVAPLQTKWKLSNYNKFTCIGFINPEKQESIYLGYGLLSFDILLTFANKKPVFRPRLILDELKNSTGIGTLDYYFIINGDNYCLSVDNNPNYSITEVGKEDFQVFELMADPNSIVEYQYGSHEGILSLKDKTIIQDFISICKDSGIYNQEYTNQLKNHFSVVIKWSELD